DRRACVFGDLERAFELACWRQLDIDRGVAAVGRRYESRREQQSEGDGRYEEEKGGGHRGLSMTEAPPHGRHVPAHQAPDALARFLACAETPGGHQRCKQARDKE